MKVLVVEDNEMNRDILSRRLKRRGWEVAIAVDGAQGLAMAASEQPAVVLMDMSLPVIDGWEATRRLRADPAIAHLPVIALTAHAMSGDREKALAAGCDDFDTKPVEFERLFTKIDALLQRVPAAAADPLQITAPAELAALPRLLAVVDAACDRHAVPAEARHDLKLVAEEACVNVMRHAYPAGAPGPLTLTVRPGRLDGQPSMLLTIEDQGRPFDPLAQAAPDLTASAEAREIGGLGLPLIRELCDQLTYQRDPVRGNVFVMSRRLNH
ncbi:MULTISPECIES: ATP-binding protein [Ramlibacter]|uniref:Response regulator n=1 Tax=Ramlibacter pinisoli TaxID=2682844 RepID=A0A6N8IRX9_9BURK|nr:MULTISPECIES: ATP-binding protein [Ramlibacter]MBA2964359.1 response regulator [Ramlibacter sp. CGMCC 1.13660]MVQ29325.1 response regulator [Ramlibacter pinisoli]